MSSFSSPHPTSYLVPLQQTSSNTSHSLSQPFRPPLYPSSSSSHLCGRIITERLDIHAIKQDLHDELQEEGLPYWKALNAYLMGQMGKGELEGMVRSWLQPDKLYLHNKLLKSLLTNAALPSHDPASSSQQRKRKRVPVNHPEFDIDESIVESKMRVEGWVMSLGKKERIRVKKDMAGAVEKGIVGGDGKDAWEGMEGKRWNPYSSNTNIPPLALPKRQLPSSHQLALRLSQFAKTHDLGIAPHATDDIGEFMAVGMDAHMADVLHSLVHLTGRDRPGSSSIRIPPGIKKDDMDVDEDAKMKASGVPSPDLETLRTLFTLHPSLHSNLSPSLHRLMTSQTLAEIEAVDPALQPSVRIPQWVASPGSAPKAALVSIEEESRTIGRLPQRNAAVSNELLASGLLKLDKAGRDGEEGKKERKHNLHWKYEDPALILSDILG